MAKTLIISQNYPLPENNGAAMRTMNFVRYFKNQGDVDIICQKDTNLRNNNHTPFRNEYLIDYNSNKNNKSNYITRILDKLIHKKTWSTSHFTSKNENIIRDIIAKGNYDYLLCRYIFQAYPLLKLNSEHRKKIILDMDDIVTDTVYELCSRSMVGISRINKLIDKCILRSYYKQCMTFGSVLFCSSNDKSKFTDSATYSKCHVVPNVYPGIKLPDNYVLDGHKNIGHLLFVGSLKYEPNLQGITWFITSVFPRLQALYIDIKLVVAGRNPPDELTELTQKYQNIELHANPPDISQFYNKCGVVIVPLFAGGGTRIKILESGFTKRPVISTEIGAYGLGLAEGKNIMLFNDVESFIYKYQQIRDDKELYSSIVHKLSEFISDHYSFDNFSQSMDAVVKRKAY